jgi:hypothetical protein
LSFPLFLLDQVQFYLYVSWWRLLRTWWRLLRTWWRLLRTWWRLLRTWWRLFQKRVMRTKFDIYVIITYISVFIFSLFYCLVFSEPLQFFLFYFTAYLFVCTNSSKQERIFYIFFIFVSHKQKHIFSSVSVVVRSCFLLIHI